MIKSMAIAVIVFVSLIVMLDTRDAASPRSITSSYLMIDSAIVDVSSLFIQDAKAQAGTSTAFLASIYYILFSAWDHFFDGLRPARINSLATDNIEAVNGIKQ